MKTVLVNDDYNSLFKVEHWCPPLEGASEKTILFSATRTALKPVCSVIKKITLKYCTKKMHCYITCLSFSKALL